MEEYETEEEFHQKKPYVEGWNLRLEVIMLCIHPGIWSNSADSPALSNDGYLLTIYKQARVWQQKLQQPFCLELQRMFQPQPPFAADFSLLPPRKDNPNHIIEIIPRSQALRQITWQSHPREIFYRYIQHEVTDSHHRCEFCHVWPVARHLTSFPVTFACGLCAFCSPCWPLYEMIRPDEREVTTQPGGQERELLQRIRQRRLQTLTPERIQDIKGLAARIKNVLDHTNQTAIFSFVPVLERTAYNEQIMAAYNASVHCLYGGRDWQNCPNRRKCNKRIFGPRQPYDRECHQYHSELHNLKCKIESDGGRLSAQLGDKYYAGSYGFYRMQIYPGLEQFFREELERALATCKEPWPQWKVEAELGRIEERRKVEKRLVPTDRFVPGYEEICSCCNGSGVYFSKNRVPEKRLYRIYMTPPWEQCRCCWGKGTVYRPTN